MMNNRILTVALAFAISLGTAASQAGEDKARQAHGKRAMMFERVDVDGDGRITREEMKAYHAARMSQFDSDGDGYLSADELRAGLTARSVEMIETRVNRMMTHHDADGDGRISPEELTARHSGKMFDRADTDGDGVLSKAEFNAMKAARRAKH